MADRAGTGRGTGRPHRLSRKHDRDAPAPRIAARRRPALGGTRLAVRGGASRRADRGQAWPDDRNDQWTLCADREIARVHARSEEHTSELQSLMRISYAVFCLKKK